MPGMQSLMSCASMTRRMKWTQRVIALLLASALGAAPTGAADDPSPYIIRLDLSGDIRDLGSDDPFVADPAADHLVALGTVALPALAAALSREPPATRAAVVEVLQEIAGKQSTALLVTAVGDADPTVRAEALLALGLRGARSAQAVVEEHLGDPDPTAQRAAILACHSVCASPAALDRLTELALRGPQAQPAQQSLRSIVTGRDAARTTMARSAIERLALPVLTQDTADPAERANAALLAALIGRREAVPVLARLSTQAPTTATRVAAIMALGGVADPSAVAALTPLLQSNDKNLRESACAALAQLRTAKVEGAARAAEPCAPAAR